MRKVTPAPLGAAEETKIKELEIRAIVEKFSETLYLQDPKFDSIRQILSVPSGKDAFMAFLITDYGIETLKFLRVNILYSSLFTIAFLFIIIYYCLEGRR